MQYFSIALIQITQFQTVLLKFAALQPRFTCRVEASTFLKELKKHKTKKNPQTLVGINQGFRQEQFNECSGKKTFQSLKIWKQ